MDRTCTTDGSREMSTQFWSENLNRRDHLRELCIRWEDNIKMDLKETGYEDTDWIYWAQDMVQ
jgi:hypothetical protein